MQNNTVLNQLHETAITTIKKLLAYLQIDVNLLTLENEGKDIMWIHTYPQVCNALEIAEKGGCSDPYDYEWGNGEQYDEQGLLFTIIILAINNPDDTEPFFWVEFIFQNDGMVKIVNGATSVHSQYCDVLLRDITGMEKGHICTKDEAFALIKSLKNELDKDRKCFERYL